MAENEIGVKVTAKNDTDKGFGDARNSVEEFSRGVSNISGYFTDLIEKIPLVGTLIAGAFSVDKIINFMMHFSDLAEKLDFASQALGMTREQVSELQLAMGMFQMDADTATSALTRLERGMAEAAATGAGTVARSFEALGISLKDAEGNMKSLEVILPEIMDRFAATENGVEKTAVALALFGRGSSNMVAFLNQGSEGLAQLQAELRETGAVMNDEFSGNALELADQFDLFNVALQGVSVTLYKELAPAFTEVMTALNESIVAFTQWEEETQAVAKTIAVVVTVFKALVLIFDLVGIAIDSMIAGVVALRDTYLTNMASIKEAVRDVWESSWAQQAVRWVTDGANKIANAGALLWEKMTNSLRDIKASITDSLGNVWNVVLEKVRAALGKLGEWLSFVPGMDDFANKLKNALGGGSKDASKELETNTGRVKATLDGIGQKIEEFTERAKKGLNLDKANEAMTQGATQGQSIMRNYLGKNAEAVESFAQRALKAYEDIKSRFSSAFGESKIEGSSSSDLLLPEGEGDKKGKKERMPLPKTFSDGRFIQGLQEELKRAEIDEKVSFDKRLQFEVDFWQSKLKTVQAGSDEYYSIAERLYPLLWQQQQQAETKSKESHRKTVQEKLAEETAAIQETMNVSLAKLDGEKQNLEASVALGRISNQEKLEAMRELTTQQFAIQIMAFQHEAELDNQTVKRKADIYARISQLRQQQANAIAQIAAQEAQAELQAQTQQLRDQQALDSLYLDGERQRLQGQIQVGEVYGEQKYQMLRDQMAAEFQMKRTQLEAEYALDNQTVERRNQIIQQMMQLDRQYYNQRMALEYQAQVETINAWQGVASAIGGPLNQMVSGVLQGTQTIQEGFRRFCGNMVLAFANMVTQMLVRWAVWLAATQVAGASIPFGSFVFGGGLLALFDEGTNYVPKDMIAGIHEGEMIIPAGEAKRIRDGMGAGGAFDGGALKGLGEQQPASNTNLNVNLTVETMDAHSFKTNINKYAGMLAKAVSDQLRLNPSLRPQF